MRFIATFWCMPTMIDNTNWLKFYDFSPITVNELTFTGHIIILISQIINYWPRLFLFHAWLTQPLNISTFGFGLLTLSDPRGHKGRAPRLCPIFKKNCVVLGENGQITDWWPHHWVGTPVWESLDPPLTYLQLSILHHMSSFPTGSRLHVCRRPVLQGDDLWWLLQLDDHRRLVWLQM